MPVVLIVEGIIAALVVIGIFVTGNALEKDVKSVGTNLLTPVNVIGAVLVFWLFLRGRK